MNIPYKPAYKIRLGDLGFGGIKRHARRCGVEKALAETFYHISPEQYDMLAKSRGLLLGLYNGVIVTGGALGIFMGLAKILG